MDKKIGKSAKLLIVSDLFYSLTSLFSDTFLVAYFLKVTNESISKIAIYCIIVFIILSAGNVLLGKIIKIHPSKAKSIMCMGMIVKAIFILSIVILGDKISNYYVYIAIFYGISESFYWCSHELIYIDVTNNKNRQNYMSIKKILSKTIKIVFPIILGTSIELYSFTKIAIYVFALTVIQIIVTLLIKTDIQNNNTNTYNLRKFLKYIKESKLKRIRVYNLSAIAYGIVESSISTLIIIITIMTFKTSFNLGVLTTIFNIFAMISLILYNKFYNKNTAKRILGLCSLVMVLGVFGLLIDINKITLIIYNFCYITTFCIFDAVYNTRKGDLVKECKIEEYKEEYIGYTVIGIGIGRVIGYLLMLLVSFANNIVCFKALLAIVTLFAPVYCYLNVKSLKDKQSIKFIKLRK